MGERVDDEKLNACILRRIDGLQITRGAEGRLQRNGQMLPDPYASGCGAHVEAAGAVFRVDDADFFPYRIIRKRRILGADQTIPKLQ